ncbi:MAG: hypothetical protein ACYC0H_13780, partial [Solirubrobacteraceae bacterium]
RPRAGRGAPPPRRPRGPRGIQGALLAVAVAVALVVTLTSGPGGQRTVTEPQPPSIKVPAVTCNHPPPSEPALAPTTCWRPYGPSSPFNRTIPASPPLVSNSAAIVRWLTSEGPPGNLVAGVAGTPADFGHPAYYSTPSDPKYRIYCTKPWGRCPIQGDVIRIPPGAQPAGGSDGHMAVVDLRTGWEYDLWQASAPDRSNGTVTASWGGRTRINGSGLGPDATAAHFGLLAGIIRAPELEAGSIDHALVMVTRCTNGYVFPAAGGGSRCYGQPDAPMAGMRIQLAMSGAQIDSLPVPKWKKTILRAFATYGAIIGDTGGSAQWGLELESGSTYTSLGMPDQLVRYATSVDIPSTDGHYILNLGSGVDWSRYLRVVAPCISSGGC